MNRLLVKFSPLLIMLVGNGLLFLSSVIYKGFLPLEDYATYGMIVTFFGAFSVVSLLGGEQVIMRLGQVVGGRLKVDRKVIVNVFKAHFLFMFLMSFGMYVSDNARLSLTLIILAGGVCAISLFIGSTLRVVGRFGLSQGAMCLWRILVPLMPLLNKELEISYELMFLMLFSMYLFILFYFKSSGILWVERGGGNGGQYFFSFSYSIIIMTLLAFYERLLGGGFLTDQEFSDLYLYSMLYLYPLTFAANYIGFKKLAIYKEKIAKSIIIIDLWRHTLQALFGFLLYYLLVLLMSDFLKSINVINIDNKTYIIVFSAIGILRVSYSILSAVVGAVASSRLIMKANIFTTVCLCFCVFVCVSAPTINSILLTSLVLIAFRIFIVGWLLSFEQLEYDDNFFDIDNRLIK